MYSYEKVPSNAPYFVWLSDDLIVNLNDVVSIHKDEKTLSIIARLRDVSHPYVGVVYPDLETLNRKFDELTSEL